MYALLVTLVQASLFWKVRCYLRHHLYLDRYLHMDRARLHSPPHHVLDLWTWGRTGLNPIASKTVSLNCRTCTFTSLLGMGVSRLTDGHGRRGFGMIMMRDEGLPLPWEMYRGALGVRLVASGRLLDSATNYVLLEKSSSSYDRGSRPPKLMIMRSSVFEVGILPDMNIVPSVSRSFKQVVESARLRLRSL